jgi:hypothetical protein
MHALALSIDSSFNLCANRWAAHLLPFPHTRSPSPSVSVYTLSANYQPITIRFRTNHLPFFYLLIISLCRCGRWVHAQVTRYLPACQDWSDKSAAAASSGKKGDTGAGSRGGQAKSRLLEARPAHACKLKPVGPDYERRARARNGAAAVAAAAATPASRRRAAADADGGDGDGTVATAARGEHVFTEFALGLLHLHLKRGLLSDAALRPMLDPYIPLLRRLLGARHDGAVAVALRCLSLLVPMGLPAAVAEAPALLAAVFFLLQRSGSTAGATAQGCFRLLVAMLRDPRLASALSAPQACRPVRSHSLCIILEPIFHVHAHVYAEVHCTVVHFPFFFFPSC